MFNCPICSKDCNSLSSITHHINKSHHENAKDIIFGTYPSLFRDCLGCGLKIKHYSSDSQSRKCCSKECNKKWRIGKKQSHETINKRIQNTDQHKKENARQETMMLKYNSLMHSFDPVERSEKISKSLSNKSHTKEHHEKITKSKIKNGNLKHTQETKEKIRRSVTTTLNSPDFDKSKLVNHTKSNLKQGYYKGFYCRSSYEKLFVDFCEEYSIELLSAENNDYAIKYESNGKIKTYFPDFYLVNFDLLIEIKPITMYNYGDNPIKFQEANKKYKFEVITENEHILNRDKWNLLYEHILHKSRS